MSSPFVVFSDLGRSASASLALHTEPASTITTTSNNNNNLQQHQHVQLRVVALQQPITSTPRVPAFASLTSSRDTLREVLATPAVLRKLQVVSGSWVHICAASDHLNKSCKRAVRILAVVPPVPKKGKGAPSNANSVVTLSDTLLSNVADDTLCIPPTLLFSLGLYERPRARRFVCVSRLVTPLLSPVRLSNPPLASRVTIARVRCPHSSGHAEYGEVLREHFSVPRVLSRGDLIGVAVPLQMSDVCAAVPSASTPSNNNGPTQSAVDNGDESSSVQENNINSNSSSSGSTGHPESSSTAVSEIVAMNNVSMSGQVIPGPSRIIYFCVTALVAQEEENDASVSAKGNDMAKSGMLVDAVGGRTVLAQAGAVNAHVPDSLLTHCFLLGEQTLRNSAPDSAMGATPSLYSPKVIDAALSTAVALPPLSVPQRHSLWEGRTGDALLTEHVDKLYRTLLPLLTHTPPVGLDFGTAVLLHGPSGTGKRALVARVAKRFQAHCKHVSLTNLRGLPEERAAKRIVSMMEDAIQMSPCVLHLRHLEALKPMPVGMGAPEPPEVLALAIGRGLSALAKARRNSKGLGVVVVMSTCAADELPSELRSCFSHDVVLAVPNLKERVTIIRGLVGGEVTNTSEVKEIKGLVDSSTCVVSSSGLAMQLHTEVSIESLAVKTAGRTATDLRAMLGNAGCLALADARVGCTLVTKSETSSLVAEEESVSAMEALVSEPASSTSGEKVTQKNKEKEEEEVEKEVTTEQLKSVASLLLTTEIVQDAIDSLPAAAVDIGAPKIPQVLWDDVGGLGDAKEEITDMVELPLKHPELFASGVRQRSGILLYGPPGTGKTLLAKAVATECALNFISVKGPELLDMYIGESERKVRQVFETARNASPCVLFFDELDSLAPQRGRGADSGGVMDRVVSQLLTELDGMQGNTNVFVIGATNRPDLLDQSLLRPGRFDRLIYLGIASDRDSQRKIVGALSRKFKLDPDVNMDSILERCPLTFTGADFYALCSGALANALKRRVEELQNQIAEMDPVLMMTPRKLLAGMPEDELDVTVKHQDYVNALATTIPSVSADEIRHYEALREQFSGISPSSSSTGTNRAIEDVSEDQQELEGEANRVPSSIQPATDSATSHSHASGHFDSDPIHARSQEQNATPPTFDPYAFADTTSNDATVADALKHANLDHDENEHDADATDADASDTVDTDPAESLAHNERLVPSFSVVDVGNPVSVEAADDRKLPQQKRTGKKQRRQRNQKGKQDREPHQQQQQQSQLDKSTLSPSSSLSESEPDDERRFSS